MKHTYDFQKILFAIIAIGGMLFFMNNFQEGKIAKVSNNASTDGKVYETYNEPADSNGDPYKVSDRCEEELKTFENDLLKCKIESTKCDNDLREEKERNKKCEDENKKTLVEIKNDGKANGASINALPNKIEKIEQDKEFNLLKINAILTIAILVAYVFAVLLKLSVSIQHNIITSFIIFLIQVILTYLSLK